MKNIRRSRNGRCSNKETGEVRSGLVDAPEGFDYYLIKLDGVSAKVIYLPNKTTSKTLR